LSSGAPPEFVPLRISEYGPGLGACLPDIDSACAERKKAFELGVPVVTAGREV
jgi:hypothetical protein